MPRYRISDPAKADIASILRASEAKFGADARVRYRSHLAAALRRLAADPLGISTTSRAELFAGLRSMHIRHSSNRSRDASVAEPVHVIFYRAPEPGLIEIVRVLHERMDPSRYVGSGKKDR